MPKLFYAWILVLALIIGASIATPGAGAAWTFLLAFLIWLVLAPGFAVGSSLKKLPWLLEEVTYRFTDFKYSVDRPSAQFSTAWMNAHSIVEFRDSYLIFTSKRVFHAVPKRFFALEERAAFDELIRKMLAAHRKPALIRASAVWDRICYGSRPAAV